MDVVGLFTISERVLGPVKTPPCQRCRTLTSLRKGEQLGTYSLSPSGTVFPFVIDPDCYLTFFLFLSVSTLVKCGAGALQGQRWTSQQQPSSHRFDPYRQVFSTKFVFVMKFHICVQSFSVNSFLSTSNGEEVNDFISCFIYLGENGGSPSESSPLANSKKNQA
jgi:hypothetical protein